MANQINAVPVGEVDTLGLIADRPAFSLPMNAWTDCNNVIFEDGAVKKRRGTTQVFGDLSFTPTFLYYWEAPTEPVWVVGANNGRLYIIKASSQTPVQIYANSGSLSNVEWQATTFGGGYYLVVNNGQEPPMYLRDNSTTLATLPGWNYNDNFTVTAGVVKALGDVLVAGDIQITNRSSVVEEAAVPVEFSSNTDIALGSTGWLSKDNSSGDDYVYLNFIGNDVPALGTAIVRANSGGTVSAVQITNWDNPLVSNDITRRVRLTVGAGQATTLTSATIQDGNGRVFILTRSGSQSDTSDNTVKGYSFNSTRSYIASASTEGQGTIRVSTVAAVGTLPSTWEPGALGDASTADELTVSVSSPIIDIVELNGLGMIYTRNSISALQVSAQLNSVTTVSDVFGAMQKDMVTNIGGMHLVVGSNDIYVHNGSPQTIQSVAEGVVRDLFYDNLNGTLFPAAHCVRDYEEHEVRIYYPTRTQSASNCNRYLAYNYKSNVWSQGDAQNVVAAVNGSIPGKGVNNPDLPWATNAANLSRNFVVELDTTNRKLKAVGVTYQFDGTNYTSFVERTKNQFDADVVRFKTLRAIYPMIEADGNVTISFGTSQYPGSDATFTDFSQAFNPQEAYRLSSADTRGRFINLRFEDNSNTAWSLSGYYLDVIASGGER